MRLLPEEGEIVLTKREDAYDLVKQITSSDKWLVVDSNKIEVKPCDNELEISKFREEYKIPDEVSDDAIRECAELYKIVVMIPAPDGYVGYPVCGKGFFTLIQRLMGKECPLLEQVKDTAQGNRLPIEELANILTTCYKTRKNLTTFLCRGEKVRCVMSDDYKIIDYYKLLDITDEELDNVVMDYSFVEASVSNEIFSFFFLLEAEEIKKNIEKVLPDDIEVFSVGCRIISSDMCESGANIYPFIKTNIGELMLGGAMKTDHKKNNPYEVFRDNVKNIIPKFEEAERQLDKLSHVSVRLIKDCILNVAAAAKLPMREAYKKAEEYEKAFGQNALQIDVFCALYEILEDLTLKKDYSTARKFELQCNITRKMFGDISAFDVPFGSK